jgi:hypothetical protein
VLDHPVEITVPGVFAFGVPNDLTLNLWYRFDPKQAAAGDRDTLANFVLIRETERHRQVEVKMREALINQIADLQEQKPLPENAATFDGVVALAPGSERYNLLLAGVKAELERTLPSLGVILTTSQSITLTQRVIPDAIIDALQRKYGRDIDSEWLTKYAGVLRQDFPDIPRAVLAQVLAAIEGVDAGKVQRLLLEQEREGEVTAEVEFEMAQDGEGPNVITKPRVNRSGIASEPRPETQNGTAESARATSQRLTKSDLAVLKRAPRRKRDQRLSA